MRVSTAFTKSGLVAALALVAASAAGAPPSSPTSKPENPKTEIYHAPYKNVFHCTGYHRSHTCATTLFLDKCENSIKIDWPPLRFPGTTKWENKHRNWCTVTYDMVEAVEEKKFHPEACEKIFLVMAAALKEFSTIPWQDANCNITQHPTAILLASQRWEYPEAPKHFTEAAKNPYAKDLDPMAVGFEGMGACQLHKGKEIPIGRDPKHPTHLRKLARELHCPVIPQKEQSWLRKFLTPLGVALVVRNPQGLIEK